jgi:hypothetical protein
MSYTDDALEQDPDELESGSRGPRFPTAKIGQRGDRLVGLMVDYDDKAPVYKYGVTPPEREINKKTGEPRTKDVLTLLVKGGDFPVNLPREQGERVNRKAPGQPGQIVRVHIQGHNRYDSQRATSWRMAKDKLGRGLKVGDVVTVWFIEATRQGYGGVDLSQDKLVVGFEVAPATEVDARLVEAARLARGDIKAGRTPSTTPPAPTGSSAVLI